MKHRAFTLIELTVVVAIIAALIAILLPSLSGARVAARRAVCGSNQKQIATATTSYAATNVGKMMSTRKTPWTAQGRHPEYINTDPDSPTDEWNVHRIQDFVNGFDIPNKRPQGVFICPFVDADFYQWLGVEHWNQQWASGHKFTQLSYGYFAGVDRWATSERRNGAERVLCESRPGGSERLLISDVLMPNGNGGLFRYNHGKRGWAWSWLPSEEATYYGKPTGGIYEYAPPSITGLMQAFGDGSVRWKDAAQIKTNQMLHSASYPDPWVDRSGGAPMYF